MPGQVRVILPPKFQDKATERVLRGEFAKYAPFLINYFNRTTSSWKGEKPRFDPVVRVKSNEMVLQIRLAGPKEGRDKWNWLNEGTKPHPIDAKNAPMLVFRTGYKAGSSPGTLFTFAGGASGEWRKKKHVNHPGNAPRKWSELIVNDQQKPFERWMQAAMKRAAAASGHEMK